MGSVDWQLVIRFVASCYNYFVYHFETYPFNKHAYRIRSLFHVVIQVRLQVTLCSCLVDVWDGANGEPIICHGYTLTTKILVKDVLQAVRSYAFCMSM